MYTQCDHHRLLKIQVVSSILHNNVQSLRLTLFNSMRDLGLAGFCPLNKIIESSTSSGVFIRVCNDVEIAQLLDVTISDRSLDCFESGHGT